MEAGASALVEPPVGYHSWIAEFLTCGRESGRGTLLGGQFDWGGRLLKCNGGAQRLAPRRLASTLQSLPPILHIKAQCSVSSYSKGSRGLSVLPRVHCIFTASSISLSLGWRQPGHHYAIRAGRNLPDKEFRYLRTVIVTAAVYRGFDQELLLTDNPIN